ncbi:MAG: potassium channel family protein [Candidatus Omnitrophota bacterium]
MLKRIEIVLTLQRLMDRMYDAVGKSVNGAKGIMGYLGTRFTYRRDALVFLLCASAALIILTDRKVLIITGMATMSLSIFLWLLMIFSWTIDPLIDFKMRIKKIKHWGKRLYKYLSFRFKDMDSRHHVEAYSWGLLAYLQELREEISRFSKTNLLEKFLIRFFSTFMILTVGYAFMYYGLYKLDPRSFVSIAKQTGAASFGSFADFVYYSGITIATVGYGDIYPVQNFARFLVIIEVMSSALLVIFLISSFTSISIHLTAERQKELINDIDEEIKSIDRIFSDIERSRGKKNG